MGLRHLVLVLLLTQLSPSDRAAVERYRSAIQSAESAASRLAIEPAFSAARALREALTQKLESLGDEEFKNLQQLQGLLINREEVVFIKPDVDYFTKLAAASGDEADRAFFAALKATYPESVWPTYIEQQTDYSGCTRFGGMTLIEAYRVWLEFQRRFPNRYVNGANEETDAVLHELTQSTCACGNAAGVELEFGAIPSTVSGVSCPSPHRTTSRKSSQPPIGYSPKLHLRINDLLHRTGDSDVQVALKMAFSCRRTHAPTRRLHPASRGFSRMLKNSSETTNAL